MLVELDDVLNYVQPTKYLVETTDYNDDFETPVLTAGKSFLLGYTNEAKGIYREPPVIIFDDFTTSFHFVDFPFKVKSSALKILKRKNDKVDIKYIYYAMSRIQFEPELHKRYWISKYSKFQIPLPPLATQKKIAAILDAADAHRQKTKKLLAKYDELAQSIFLDMFGDPVTNPKGWEVRSLEECTIKIGSGATPRGGKDAYKSEGISLIRSLNIHDNEFKIKNLAFIDNEQADALKNVIVEEGDVLFNITGASVCRCCIVPNEILPARVNQHVSILRPNDRIDSEYLVYFMTSRNQKIKLFELATKGGATREAITKQDLQEMEIIVPPISLQKQFSQMLELIRRQIADSREEILKSENLFNSLLQKAFKGGLV